MTEADLLKLIEAQAELYDSHVRMAEAYLLILKRVKVLEDQMTDLLMTKMSSFNGELN